jgi:hypothetical protein
MNAANDRTPPIPMTFSKEDLIHMATSPHSTNNIRRSAAEALYTLGKCDGAKELTSATRAAMATKS